MAKKEPRNHQVQVVLGRAQWAKVLTKRVLIACLALPGLCPLLRPRCVHLLSLPLAVSPLPLAYPPVPFAYPLACPPLPLPLPVGYDQPLLLARLLILKIQRAGHVFAPPPHLPHPLPKHRHHPRLQRSPK